MIHLKGKEIFADDVEGFRRKVIDEGEGPIRSYAYAPARDGECPYHCHADSVEIFQIVEGEGAVVMGEREVRVAAPDVIVIDPGEYHLVRAGSGPFKMLAVVSPNLDDGQVKDRPAAPAAPK